jgi:hypothetical protein
VLVENQQACGLADLVLSCGVVLNTLSFDTP